MTRRWNSAGAEGWGGCFCCSDPDGEKEVPSLDVFYTQTGDAGHVAQTSQLPRLSFLAKSEKEGLNRNGILVK